MDMKNLKAGDKVRVISEEEVRKHRYVDSLVAYEFDNNWFNKDMFKFCGKIVTISEAGIEKYYIKESESERNWRFTYDMFETVDEPSSDTSIYPPNTEDCKSVNSLVSHPSHYQLKNGLEVIQVIEAFTDGLNGIDAVDIGNAVKYLGRLGKKDDIIQDAEKAAWYLNHFIERNKAK